MGRTRHNSFYSNLSDLFQKMKILAINCHPDLSYFTNRGLQFDVTYETLTEKFPLNAIKTAQDQYGNTINFFSPFPQQYLENKYKTFQYSIILVGFNPQDYDPRGNSTGGYTHSVSLSCGTFWATVREDPYTNDYIVHELHHALVYILNVNFGLNKSNQTMIRDYMDLDFQGRPYYLNNDRENPQSNHAQTWSQIKLYLSKLLTITYPTQMKTYLNFNPKSDPYMIGVDSKVMDIAQKIRTATGIPMKLTSGLRTVAQNNTAGGVSNSAHLKGLALDFAITNQTRQAFLKALLTCGTPVFIEDCPDHLHFDIDSSIHPLGDMIVSQNG